MERPHPPNVHLVTLTLRVNAATYDDAVRKVVSHFPSAQWPTGSIAVRRPMPRKLLGDERSVEWRGRMAGLLGPVSSAFTFAWLATHRDRLRTLVLGGYRLSIFVLWDTKGAARVHRTDAQIEALKTLMEVDDGT